MPLPLLWIESLPSHTDPASHHHAGLSPYAVWHTQQISLDLNSRQGMGNDTESHVGYVEEFLIVGIPGGGNALLNRLLSACMIFSTRMSWATMLMQKDCSWMSERMAGIWVPPLCAKIRPLHSPHIGGTVTEIGMHNFWNINANGTSLLQAQIAAWFVKSQCRYDFWSLNCGDKRCSNHCMRNKALCISPSESDWYMHNLTNEHSACLLHTPSRVLHSWLASWIG